MQYMLMLYANEGGWTSLTKTEQEQGVAAYAAYTEALKTAGALVSGGVCSRQRLRRPYVSRTASRRCSTDPMWIRKSNWGATTSSTCPISMPPSRGRLVAQPRVTAWSRCVRSGTLLGEQ